MAKFKRGGSARGRRDGELENRTVVITSPEELIASVPSLLGFPPGPGSVVLMCGKTADGGQGPVVRVDAEGLIADRELDDDDDFLELDGHDDDADADDDADDHERLMDEGVARGIARFCAREGVTQVHLVVVHEACAELPGARRRAADAADVFGFCLEMVGTTVSAAYGVGEFAEGAPWADLFGMLSGVQMDPGSTEIAAVHTFEGRTRAESREEIEELYLQRDADACDGALVGDKSVRLTGAGAVRAGVKRHDEAVLRAERGQTVVDTELAEVGAALLDIAVRDEVYAQLARRRLGEDDGRRLLWWALARRRPGPERSVALMLLGAAAYFSGSGVHARAALAAAVAANPGNNLAGLLLTGLDSGLPPERLRQVAAA